MESLSMEQADWKQLFEFVTAANDARIVIQGAAEQGKQQVSLSNSSIDSLRSVEAPPGFWLKLGNLIGSQLHEGEAK